MYDEMTRGMIAFDGLSLAGKSTMVQMLSLRSLDAVVIRENEFDPIRSATSHLNKLCKSTNPYAALDTMAEEYADDVLITDTCSEAKQYLREIDLDGPSYGKIKQATLAYFFTKGRSFVNREVVKQLKEQDKDVILDRWWVSGMAYQVQPDMYTARQMGLSEDVTGKLNVEDEAYRWERIRDLNFEKGVWVPNMQVILTCPVEQIPIRRSYRQKQGKGTSGQMSGGREDLIYHSLMEIHDWLLNKGIPSYKIQNEGAPVESLQDQIKQAVPTYLTIENELRNCIQASFHNFRLNNDVLNQNQAEEFFLEPNNMKSIYQRQCLGRVKEDMQKEI